MAWNLRGPGYVPGVSYSIQFVFKSTKHQKWLPEDHDEQVAQTTYLANLQAMEATIPIILQRRVAQFL